MRYTQVIGEETRQLLRISANTVRDMGDIHQLIAGRVIQNWSFSVIPAAQKLCKHISNTEKKGAGETDAPICECRWAGDSEGVFFALVLTARLKESHFLTKD